MKHTEIIAEMTVVDLYEAWRLDGKVWLRLWSGGMLLVKIPCPLLSCELDERGVSMAEARAEWSEFRKDVAN